ncbi:MAG: hypothetical protein C0483_26070 [Pirellula sp.]|nr:hypothetical protein [Pirellula sp.]
MTKWLSRSTGNRKRAVLCSLGFAGLSLALAVPLLLPTATPSLRLSAGPDATRRHAVAVYLCEQAARNELSIELTANAGSEKCLELLKTNQLDAAIVSSGVVMPGDDDIMVLGALQLEAIHLLVRKDIAQASSLIEGIRGRRINLGEHGSTERLVAHEFLRFARLKIPDGAEPGDVSTTEFGKAELIDRARLILRADGEQKQRLIQELPDGLLVLATMPSQVVQLLVEAAGYEIVPLPAARAFLLDNLQQSDPNKTVLQREFLERTSIPSQSYFAKRDFPDRDCETVGVRLLVVARSDVSARSVRALMKTIFEGEFARRILPKSPRDLATSYAVHPAAVAYLDRDKPLIVNDLLDWLSNGLSILGAFCAGALALYSLLLRRRGRRPSDYLLEIRKIDHEVIESETHLPARSKLNELVKRMDQRLLSLRRELIEDLCEGRIKGDQVVSNILVLLKDTRRDLATLDQEARVPGEPLPTSDHATRKNAA